MRVIYARTRYVYDSYQDFWKLVELAGLPVCFVDEIDVGAEAVYVTTPMTGELKSRELPKAGRRCLIVWWNLERPDGEFVTNFRETIDRCLEHVDDVWVSDRHYQSLDSRMRFVPLGSHPGLAPESPGAADGRRWDVAHLSYVSGRRNHIYGQFPNLNLSLAPNAWEPERGDVLRNSKVLVNVHQTDSPVGEPLRFALAAAYRACLVSENCADAHPLQSGDIVEAPYADLAAVCREICAEEPDARAARGRALHDRLCREWRFPRGADAAAADLLRERGRQ